MLNDLGVDPHVVEQLTGHQMPGMQRVYNHSRYLDAKRDALDMWTERLGILAGTHENVTTLPIARENIIFFAIFQDADNVKQRDTTTNNKEQNGTTG